MKNLRQRTALNIYERQKKIIMAVQEEYQAKTTRINNEDRKPRCQKNEKKSHIQGGTSKVSP